MRPAVLRRLHGAEGIGQVANCPTCRAPVAVPADVDVERLLRLVTQPSSRHAPAAQVNLGAMHSDCTRVLQNDAEVARCMAPARRRPCREGYANAQFNLAEKCASGAGVLGTRRGSPAVPARCQPGGLCRGANAQNDLAATHNTGTGVQQDFTEARLYRLAADQWHAGGQCCLGLTCANSTGSRGTTPTQPSCTAFSPTRGSPTAVQPRGVVVLQGHQAQDTEAVPHFHCPRGFQIMLGMLTLAAVVCAPAPARLPEFTLGHHVGLLPLLQCHRGLQC